MCDQGEEPLPAESQQQQTGILLRAAYEGDVGRVVSLLQEGLSVNAANSAGLQALHFAAKSGHVDVAVELLKNGATVNAASLKGHTPLHVASLLGQREIVKLLLRRGAHVNSQSQCFGDNFSPLYMAAQIGHQEIATLLLAHGADPTIATNNGSTARDIASQQGYRALAELLEEYERRLANGSDVNGDSLGGASSSGGGRSRLSVRPPSVFNRDVITSPRNSPMRATSFEQYLRSSTGGQPGSSAEPPS